jgi:hypothetical protein
MTFVETVLSVILLPIYSKGLACDDDTVEFNKITLARVEEGSARMWATFFAWYAFVSFFLYDFGLSGRTTRSTGVTSWQ